MILRTRRDDSLSQFSLLKFKSPLPKRIQFFNFKLKSTNGWNELTKRLWSLRIVSLPKNRLYCHPSQTSINCYRQWFVFRRHRQTSFKVKWTSLRLNFCKLTSRKYSNIYIDYLLNRHLIDGPIACFLIEQHWQIRFVDILVVEFAFNDIRIVVFAYFRIEWQWYFLSWTALYWMKKVKRMVVQRFGE